MAKAVDGNVAMLHAPAEWGTGAVAGLHGLHELRTGLFGPHGITDLAFALSGPDGFRVDRGTGRDKAALLERTAAPGVLALMQAVKGALDPGGIMNPGAVLRTGPAGTVSHA